MAEHYLDFEQPILDIVTRVRELETMQAEGRQIPEKDIGAEIERLRVKQARGTRLVYRGLTPWQRVQVARHPERPQPLDYIEALLDEYEPLHGDRRFGDDKAMVGGLGRLNGQPVAVLGVDKGRTTQERMARNFGMPRPEGYRKAQRIMELADKFDLPLLTFVDTPGAYPGVDAEARGQGEAIASSIETLLTLDVPVMTVITGEGGSGGALALATADRTIMLENSVYSVISPEGCAAILWKEATKHTVPEAAEALGLTAETLQKHGLVDVIVKEPVGGAHRDPELMIQRVAETIQEELADLMTGNPSKQTRRERFLNMTV